MAIEKARFLGYDPAGDAVFQDLSYPSDAPKSWIAGTSFPQLDSPDVFRLSRDAAEKSYGNAYAAVNEIHPELSRRIPFSEQELAERAAEFDQWFGITPSVDDGVEDRRELIKRTKEVLTRAAERAGEDREAEVEQRQMIRESAAFHGGWVPGNPTEEQRQQLREDYVRRQEWNELVEKRSVDQAQQKPITEMTREEIVSEARLAHAQLAHLNERLERTEGTERAQIREEMKPFAKRENELRDEYLSRRKAEALGEPSREQTIRILRAFAKDRSQEDYAVPEVAIARNLANQLEAGAKQIDLSQRYWTANSAEAEERHQKALDYLEKNLGPVLRQAEKQAERLDYGKAIAHGNKQQEVLAVANHDIKRGLANAAGLLQSAANHNHHVVQAPRLSISDGMGGGL
jgi:hypothetical protein